MEGRQWKGSDGPGGGRIEPRAGIAGDPHEAPRRAEASCDRAQRVGAAPRCPAGGERRGERVAEVVAAVALLVVAASAPGSLTKVRRRRDACGDARRRDPAGRVALRRPPRNRPPGSAEPRRGGEVEPQQEAADSPRLGLVAGRGEGDRHAGGVARPDVRPARPGAGDDRAAARVGRRPQHQQRAPVHAPRPAGRTRAERPRPSQPAPVPSATMPAPRLAPGRASPPSISRAPAMNAGTIPGNPRGTGGSAELPPEKAVPATRTSTPSAIPARAQATPESKQPRDAPGASLPPAQPRAAHPGEVAQLVEHTTENRGVVGSIPTLAIALQSQKRRPPRRRFCARVNARSTGRRASRRRTCTGCGTAAS